MIRVSIVEDHSPTRESLAELLQTSPEIEVVGAYGSAPQAEREIPQNLPDVVLMDINLAAENGIESVRVLKAAHSEVEFLMLTTYDDTDLIFSALRAGASGYLLKKAASDELVRAVKDVHTGGSPMSMEIARRVVSHFHQIQEPVSEIEKLSKREVEILDLLSEGKPYKQIAQTLDLSVHTVHSRLRRIYEKLHVQSGIEAVAKYLANWG